MHTALWLSQRLHEGQKYGWAPRAKSGADLYGSTVFGIFRNVRKYRVFRQFRRIFRRFQQWEVGSTSRSNHSDPKCFRRVSRRFGRQFGDSSSRPRRAEWCWKRQRQFQCLFFFRFWEQTKFTSGSGHDDQKCARTNRTRFITPGTAG